MLALKILISLNKHSTFKKRVRKQLENFEIHTSKAGKQFFNFFSIVFFSFLFFYKRQFQWLNAIYPHKEGKLEKDNSREAIPSGNYKNYFFQKKKLIQDLKIFLAQKILSFCFKGKNLNR